MKLSLISLLIFLLIGCSTEQEQASFELQQVLKETEVSCEFLAKEKYSKGFWVRDEQDGYALLVISKNNTEHEYTLTLTSHFQERALEIREIRCD